jgi:choline kinase
MKALILADGPGTRIRGVHGDGLKCLIQFNGSTWTLLDQQIDSLFSCGVRDIGIVVGYEKDRIIRHVVANYWGSLSRFRFIENPQFAETNTIYSLWLAREWLTGGSFVCLNSDVVFDRRILPSAVSSPAPINLIVDPAWRDEMMKVVVAGTRVIRISRQISRSEFSGTCVGITTIAAGIQKRLFARIADLIETGHESESLNAAVQLLADEGVEVGFTGTSDLPWTEIADPGDLAFARLYVFPKLHPAAVQKPASSSASAGHMSTAPAALMSKTTVFARVPGGRGLERRVR